MSMTKGRTGRVVKRKRWLVQEATNTVTGWTVVYKQYLSPQVYNRLARLIMRRK